MTEIDALLHDRLCDFAGTHQVKLESVSGGSINKAFKVIAPNSTLFCKVNSATKFPHLFNKEAAGLSLLEKQGIIKTPKVIAVFETASHQALLLEWIESAATTPAFFKQLGVQLAALLCVQPASNRF